MATRKRATSETGAYMSQYDQEVEKRLSALEEKSHSPCGGSGSSSDLEERVAALETKLDALIAILKMNPKNGLEKLSHGIL